MGIARWLCLRMAARVPKYYRPLIEVSQTILAEEKTKGNSSTVVREVNDGVDDYGLFCSAWQGTASME